MGIFCNFLYSVFLLNAIFGLYFLGFSPIAAAGGPHRIGVVRRHEGRHPAAARLLAQKGEDLPELCAPRWLSAHAGQHWPPTRSQTLPFSAQSESTF